MDDTTSNARAEALDLIWGAKEIGEAIGRNPRQTFYLLEKGELPARQVGSLWVASREALRRHLLGEAA